MTPNTKLVGDLAYFARAHISSKDIDPAYPVLQHIQYWMGLTGDDALRATLQYVAWYNLSSAVQVWIRPDRSVPKLPTGVERRGLRDIRAMTRHLESIEEQRWAHGSYRGWLQSFGPGWKAIGMAVQEAWGNGRWAAYKTCELLEAVHEWPIVASDMANTGGTGHIAGLTLLYGVLDAQGLDDAAHDLKARLMQAHGLHIGWSQLETVLCDFHSMSQGHYYVGHDIDQMLEAVMKPDVPQLVRDLILTAREATLPGQYLGEFAGWTGVDPVRAAEYKTSGRILVR